MAFSLFNYFLEEYLPPGSSTPPAPSPVSAYVDAEQPPSKLTGRLRLWEESARAVVVHSPTGKQLAVAGGRNIIQVSLILSEDKKRNEKTY